MLRLMSIGLVAGLFFSATFVLNRLMSLENGHWFWSASLRYAYTLLLLGLGLRLFKGGAFCRAVLGEFRRHWRFWCAAGSIGFGGFYALLCFAADFAPAWVVAATWQFTIIASLFVLACFGKRPAGAIWLYALVVFVGVALVNLSEADLAALGPLLLGALPVLAAAFLYPLGNQLVWEAKQGRRGLPSPAQEVVDNAFAKVFLMALGSVPFWLVLYAFTTPGAPTTGQLANTALVALFGGVFASALFLYARSQARNASQLAAVDATQASEAVFALAGEILLLGAAPPNAVGLAGLLIAAAGLIAFVRHEH